MSASNRKEILLIGGVGNAETFGGEASKNKLIIRRLRQEGFAVRIVDTLGASRRPWKLLRLIPQLLNKPNTPIIISTAYANIEWLVKILWHVNRKRPVFLWVIGGLLPRRVASGRFGRKYFSLFRHLFVEGNKMKREFAELGINHVSVVRNFKNIDYLPNISHRIKSVPTRVKFMFLSRIIAEKGVDNIIEAADILNAEGLTDLFSVDFFGEIENGYDAFHQAVDHTPNLTYAGKIDLYHSEGYDTLAKYHCMLFPTRWIGEGHPGVLADALIAGLPVIASDWSLNPELITPGQTGTIIPTNDSQALAIAMREMIEHPDVLNRMAIRCQSDAITCDYRAAITPQVITEIKAAYPSD